MTIRIMIQDVPEGEAVQEERGQEEAADRLGVVLIPMEHLPEAPQGEVLPEALLPEVLLQGEVPEEGEAQEGPEAADITVAATVRIMEEGTESPGMITGSLHWEGFF